MLIILRFERFGIGEGEVVVRYAMSGVRGLVLVQQKPPARLNGNTSMCRDHDVLALQLC